MAHARTKLSLIVTTAILASTLAMAAEGPSPEERAVMAAETRQGLLKVVVSYFGPIVGMARDQIPYDAATVKYNATRISELTAMIPDVFRADTRAFDLDTEALDPIWDNLDDFATKARTVSEAASALAAVSGDQDAAMQAFQKTGGSCKACHDEYRQQN